MERISMRLFAVSSTRVGFDCIDVRKADEMQA
jgi:hypothetical protein